MAAVLVDNAVQIDTILHNPDTLLAAAAAAVDNSFLGEASVE